MFFLSARILPLVIVGALLFFLVRSIVVALSGTKRTVREAACEMCRYPVAGLAGARCPECGTDLRLTGIITREMELRRRGSLASALLAWAVLWLVVGFVGVLYSGRFFFALYGQGQVSSVQTVTILKSTLAPASGRWGPSTLTTSAMYNGVGAYSGSSDFSISGPAGAATLSVNSSQGEGGITQRYTITTPDGERTVTGSFGASEGAALFRGAGLSITGADEIAEVNDVVRIVGALNGAGASATTAVTVTPDPAGPTFKAVPAASDRSLWPLVASAVMAGVWLALGLWVATLIYRRRRRVLRRVAVTGVMTAAGAQPAGVTA